MDTDKLYNKGTRVWLHDKEVVWKSGTVVAYLPGTSITVRDQHDQEVKIALKEGKKSLPPLRNPDILTMENNLTTMSYLHEPAVLHSLYQRFTQSNQIYTYCGIVLVAINPYCDVPLYGTEMIWAYKGQQMGQLDPHIYAISEDAYSEMKTLGRNQSIIVSGESGAGKTVSAKYAMRYFATVAGNEQETAIERRILSTNPIMEALGNAKTIRNDNSSRFGKYVELEFDRAQNIIGAHICTYLLEKSRVVFQANNERNYHIFYQLCAVRGIPEMKHLHLEHPDSFRYTALGHAPVIDHVDDSEMFYEMSESMFNMGITEEQQLFLYSVLAGILHLGNVQFNEERNDACSINGDSKALVLGAKLLGLDPNELKKWLCHKKLKTRNETVVMTLRVGDAKAGLEAFVKHIYACLFLWIVKILNSSLTTTGKNDAVNFIGILDIYGFEMFEDNSFEQFCINYANEKLQQQFNQHVFKLEQNEYIKEEITWSFIDFYDNQPCIDLIEKKMGIIDLLDEQCRMNRGTDEDWLHILNKQHSDSVHFQRPRTGTEKFVIVHYADNVAYTVHGFIAKNLDAVNDSHISLLQTSTKPTASEVFIEAGSGEITSPKKLPKQLTRRNTTSTLGKARTVGAQFKTSLNLLMDALTTTVPHFVRCIKPNDDKEPFGFVETRVVQQLRACGVIETVRISAAGYPSRWSYVEFIHRYSLLVHSSKIVPNELMTNCRTVLHSVVSDEDKYQFGKTKIFFRAGQVAYFEKLRSERLFSACVTMQAHVRGWLVHKRYQRMKDAALKIQCLVRSMIARRRVQRLREIRAAINMQRHVRGFVQRQKYKRLLNTTLFLQSAYRGNVARKAYLQVKYEKNARIIQKHIRGWLARCAYKEHVRKIIHIQSCTRRYIAQKQLKALKVEARSIGHFKKLNVKLEKRIFELQMKNKSNENEQKQMMVQTQDKVQELVLVKDQLIEQTRASNELSKELGTASSELKDLKKDHLEMKLALAKKERDQEEIEELKQRIRELEQELEESKNTVDNERIKSEERYVELEKGLRSEIASEREHHQKMLIENSNLQRQLQEIQTIAELRDREEDSKQTCNGSGILPIDENERKRLEEIIIENVQLKEDMDRTTDELMDAIDELTLIRTKYEQMEVKLSGTKDSLMKDIANTRNPRQAQDRIRFHMDQLRVVLFSDVAKLNKSKVKTEEDAVLQNKVETLAGENIKLLDEITALQNAMPTTFISDAPVNKKFVRQDTFSSVRQKKQDFKGMLICKKEDDGKLVKRLITQLKTEYVTGPGCTLGLTAHLMFMCVRYADHINDEGRIQELLTAMITGVTSVTRKRSKDPIISTFWLSQCLTLLHDLTQFSGEEPYHSRITPGMQDFALRNYDLSDYRNLLSDQCINIYHTLVKAVQDDIQPLLVPGMLEHDSIPGMNTSFSGGRRQSQSERSCDTITIINRLQFFLQLLLSQNVQQHIVKQLMYQVLYFINSCLLNNLLLRKDLCHWSKGIQIRYNLSQIEQWVREQNLDVEEEGVLSGLADIRQASQLLQMNKSNNDNAAAICETCHSLNTLQIQKLLTLYSPSSEFEERVPQTVIKYILNYRPIKPGVKLMMDPNKFHPVQFTFEPHDIDFTMFSVPEGLRLNFLERY